MHQALKRKGIHVLRQRPSFRCLSVHPLIECSICRINLQQDKRKLGKQSRTKIKECITFFNQKISSKTVYYTGAFHLREQKKPLEVNNLYLNLLPTTFFFLFFFLSFVRIIFLWYQNCGLFLYTLSNRWLVIVSKKGKKTCGFAQPPKENKLSQLKLI